jgi:hypothetical protein
MPAKTLFLALAMIAAAGAAAAGELPSYERDQVFVFDDGRVEHVRDIEDGRITWASRSGRTYERAPNPATPILKWSYRGQEGERLVAGDPDTIFPLRPGATARFETVNIVKNENAKNARRTLHLWSCWVEESARTATPAGDFDAFPIVCDRFSAATMRTLDRTIWHYAPDVGHYVRRESRSLRDGARQTYRLHSALPPREANAVRIEHVASEAAAGAGAGETVETTGE